MRTIVPFILAALTVQAQSLDFSPVHGKRVDVWNVSGCGGGAVPASVVWHALTRHGVAWLTPSQATEAIRRRSPWGRTVTAIGFAAVGASALIQLRVVAANQSIENGV